MKVLLVVDLTSKGFYTSGKELGSTKGELGCAKSLVWWIKSGRKVYGRLEDTFVEMLSF
jgi:hypothetical protein